MSGNRSIVLTLSVRDAATVKQELERIGPAGEQALQRLEAAAQRASGRGGGGGVSGLGQTITQAGFQLQDFAVQIQAGTSALTSLSQQGSQFLGIFGAGGAIAGAVLAAGLLAAQFITGGDAAKALNDALKNQKDLYDALNDAAERRASGQADEVQRVLRLRDYYASLSEAQLRGVEAQRRAADAALQAEGRRALDGATSRVRRLLAVGQQDDEFGLARTPESLLAVEAAYISIAVSSGNATAQLQRYIGELEQAIAKNPQHASTLLQARDAAIALTETFTRIDAASRAAGRGIDEATLAAARLAQQVAASNVGQGLTAQLFAAQQIAARYARGDVAGARALTREQEIDARAQALADQARNDARRGFPEGTDRAEIDRALAARRDQIEGEARRLAETERRNRESEAAAREAETAARRGSRAGAAAERREERLDERSRRERDQLISSLDAEAAANIRLEESLRRIDEARRRNLLSEQEAISLSQQVRDRREQEIVRARDKSELDRDALRETQALTRDLGQTFDSAFEDAIIKGQNLRTVLAGIAEDLARLALRKAVTEPLVNAAVQIGTAAIGSLFGGGGVSGFTYGAGGYTGYGPFTANALGNAFVGGRLYPFATGGVVDRATVLPMALMGEAGPEAVMPLDRDGSGKLGVRAKGGGGSGVSYTSNITIDARGADAGAEQRIRQSIDIAVARSKAELLSEIQRGGRAAKVVGRR